jgi:hypothetical protein
MPVAIRANANCGRSQWTAGLAALLAAGCVAAPNPEPITLPGIRAIPAEGEIRVDGAICLERGILEYVAVAKGGKEYESLIALDCQPSHLHLALMLTGDETPEGRAVGPGSPPGVRTPSGFTADVEVESAGGSWDRVPVEHYLVDRATRTRPQRLIWSFTGSFFSAGPDGGDQVYVADLERSVIALCHDATAVLNLTWDHGNPYQDPAAGLEVRTSHVPPVGTRVRLILRWAGEEGKARR